ncbi:MAG: hypothetical protein Q8Q14_16175 [Gemmatimonadales bacterium]|nr:hypothetical protein [Gemmatimonadales bacterium]
MTRLATLALAAAVALTVATTADACPAGLADPAHEDIALPIGCPALFSGRLVLDAAWQRVSDDAAAADAVIRVQGAEVLRLRAERDRLASDARDEMWDAAAELRTVAKRLDQQPGPAIPSWAWVAGGSGLVGAGLIGCGVRGCDATMTAGVAVLSAAAGVAAAWMWGE